MGPLTPPVALVLREDGQTVPVPEERPLVGEARGILVIGLGRFGRALARTLLEQGHEVMGVDADAVRELGASDFETAVVAIGTDVEAGILAIHPESTSKSGGYGAKAITGSHGAILERVGAHRVVFPERDMGIRVAHTWTDARSTTYLPRTRPAFALVETTVPKEVAGTTLAKAEIGSR